MTRPGRVERSLIAVTGPDARPFLQNVLTQDLDKLDDAGVVYAALLSPQGKVCADMDPVEMFSKIDTDHDGKITIKEFMAFAMVQEKKCQCACK